MLRSRLKYNIQTLINYHQFIIFICVIDFFYFSTMFSIFRNTSIIHQISKFFFFSPKFSIRYPSGSSRYAYFRRSEHKIICIIMRKNQICVQIFRSVRKLFRKIAKNTKNRSGATFESLQPNRPKARKSSRMKKNDIETIAAQIDRSA